MRRIPRLPTPSAAGFVPSQIQCGGGALRAPAAAVAAIAATSSPSPRLNTTSKPNRRYLSTTPLRPAQTQPQPTENYDADLAAYEQDDLAAPVVIATPLVYPQGVSVAPLADDVSDPAYKPAETAQDLEEVGGLADWWEQPAHWGNSEGGVTAYVRSVVRPFGPADKVTDPAVLEVLVKRAVVEAIVVTKFAGANKRKAVDRLFAHADAADRLGKIVGAEVIAHQGTGVAALKTAEDESRVWQVLKSAVVKSRVQQQQEVAEGEAEAEAARSAPQLTPQIAQSWIGRWDQGWKQAKLRNPVVKFYAAKRIFQLTGHRIPDAKLVNTLTVEEFLKLLLEPPKAPKLAELVQSKAVFADLPNVRVFPRRVTPVDKEKMVGRWKIIVKELEKRELPVIGLGDESAAVEKKWVSGKA